ncbi:MULTISPECIES: helix-turn-helix domain-containing protein [Streptococcus]|nr:MULTISPECIES: helix-turn-helix transcriptional regulator [Streptococcus]MDP1384062.1 helix-turn-helix transcriptional regulator [Streptococcus anginosus]ORJ29710.1 XRE family transcriptional regulator [Streptococcus oralis subsp. tigurinus]QQT10019.1 helix-turn-helix transcriptional regulator [Streptococcus anginosus]
MYRRLKDLREDHDLSQNDIAKYLFCSQSAYSRIENGIQDIPSKYLIKLAKFYSVTTDYILGMTDIK